MGCQRLRLTGSSSQLKRASTSHPTVEGSKGSTFYGIAVQSMKSSTSITPKIAPKVSTSLYQSMTMSELLNFFVAVHFRFVC